MLDIRKEDAKSCICVYSCCNN